MTVRLRFALLYAGALLISGVLVLGVAFFSVKETVRAGSAGPPIVSNPAAQTLGPLTMVVVSLIALVLLSLVSGWLLAGRLLRPVRAITAAAQDISASNLGRRLTTGRRGDEFARLGETLNDLFARLEASFRAQRHFVANASHELRTPLTAERTLLQVALADPEADAATLREACEQVLALGERTERLVDALLTLATGERGLAERTALDLAEVATAVTRSRDEQASRSGVHLDTVLTSAPVTGDPRLVESLIVNLCDNALRYNEPGGWARVATSTRDGHALVSVSNTGPRIAPDEVARLFRPFERLGSSRVTNSDGHGLGLAIVGAIADAHGATISARARAEGGLDIDVIFP